MRGMKAFKNYKFAQRSLSGLSTREDTREDYIIATFDIYLGCLDLGRLSHMAVFDIDLGYLEKLVAWYILLCLTWTCLEKKFACHIACEIHTYLEIQRQVSATFTCGKQLIHTC